MPRRKPINPFYVLLLLSGCAFAVTACAFGVMTVRQLHRSRQAIEATDSFTEVVDQYGVNVMIVELVLLGIGTMGAIGYDQHLDKREASLVAGEPKSPSAEESTEEVS